VTHLGNAPENHKRYSPVVCQGCAKIIRISDPEEKHISTSYVERQNLTMRMSMRCFIRLTNAFSKKIENRVASIAIHYMYLGNIRTSSTSSFARIER